jgi:hypothetical protein
MQSVPITTDVLSSNLDKGEVNNIVWWSTRSIQNDTLENRIVALEKLVEKLEDSIKNGTKLELQLPMHSVPITTDVVSLNLDQGEVYNIMW